MTLPSIQAGPGRAIRLLFVLLIVVAPVRAFDAHAQATGDRGTLVQFAFLIAALAVVFRVAA